MAVINPLDAISAYSKGSGLGGSSASGASALSGGDSFSDMLSNFDTDAIKTLHEGEKATTTVASGSKVDMAGVASAIDNAEVVLDEVVAIRDKMIAAYQAITSSAI